MGGNAYTFKCRVHSGVCMPRNHTNIDWGAVEKEYEAEKARREDAEYRTRCPGCALTEYYAEYPTRSDAHCKICDRSMGVIPTRLENVTDVNQVRGRGALE